MKKGRFTEEHIISILKLHEDGAKVADIVRQYGIAEQTFYRWGQQGRQPDVLCVGRSFTMGK